MKASQWWVLAIGCYLMMFWFISMDVYSPLDCGGLDGDLDSGDVWCIFQAEMFDPFIYLLFPLGLMLSICGILEEKKE